MELKIKDDGKITNDEDTYNDDAFPGYSGDPIKISTDIDYDVPKKKSSDFDVMVIVKVVVIIAVVVLVVKLFSNWLNPKVVDVTECIGLDANGVANELDIDMKPDANMAKQIHHYSQGTVTVEGNGEVGVIYIDGVYAGLHVDVKGYSLFGVAIGDPEYDAVEALSFDYDDSMVVLDDLMSGNSSTVYYYNLQKNNCVALITNGNTNRIVAITYFSNYAKVTETLDMIE